MLIKILLKIWPALVPIAIYLIWQFVIKKIINKLKQKNNTIEGEKIINDSTLQDKKNNKKIFDLSDKNLIITLYLSLIIMILCLIILAFS